MHRRIAEGRRREIVESVVQVLRLEGLSYPSYDSVAGQAHLSRQLVRHYFPDPEELMVVTCATFARGYRRALSEGLVKAPPAERLEVMLDLFFGLLEGEDAWAPGDHAVWETMLALAHRSDPIQMTLRDHCRELQAMIAEELRLGRPELSPADCSEVGFLFVALVAGHWTVVNGLGAGGDHGGATRRAMARILDSYAAQPAEPVQA